MELRPLMYIKICNTKLMYGEEMGKYEQKLKLLKLFGNVSYMSVNGDIKYWLHILLFDGVTTLNVH